MGKDVFGGRKVEIPILGGGLLESGFPLGDAGFFADVDFLAGADETDDDAPLGDALGKFDEEFGFGTAVKFGRKVFVLFGDLFGVESSLGFIVDEDVLGWNEIFGPGEGFDIVVNAADEGFSVAAGRTKLVLEDFDEGAVAGEEDGGGGWY